MRDEDFIRNLTADLQPKSSLASSQGALLGWMLLTFVVLISGILLVSLRDDVRPMLETASFHLEMFSALTVAIVAAGTALHLRIPGSLVPRKVLSAVVGIWIVSLMYHGYVSETGPFLWGEALHCMVSIAGLSALPGLALYLLVRRGSTTQPKETLAIIGIAMTAAAAAFIPLACGNDTMLHLVLGHSGPLFVMSFLFWWAGPSLLKW